MLRPVRVLAALSSLSLLFVTACDSQPAGPPGVDQDTTNTADLIEGDSAADSASDAADTAVAPDTADTAVPEDTNVADTAVPEDTTPDTTGPGDTTVVEDVADTTVEDTSTPADTTIVIPTTRPPIVTTATTFAGDWVMQPGKEVTKCVVKRLTNPEVLWVSQVRTVLSKGSHHLIVYKSDETVERATPFNCEPFVETLKGQTFPLMITQIREETLTFPNGIAFKFEPNQMVRLEAHYLNYFPNDITAHADVYFDGIAASDVVAEANMLFYGNPDLKIPKGPYSTPWRFLSVLPGTNVFAITGHTHAYGTSVEIAKSDSVENVGETVYPGQGETFVWDEPPVTRFAPALSFDEGEGFRYRCSWNNTSAGQVEFGESANAEMCFLWAYYYPSQGYRICLSPGSIGGGVAGDEVCCPGSWVCSYVSQFL